MVTRHGRPFVGAVTAVTISAGKNVDECAFVRCCISNIVSGATGAPTCRQPAGRHRHPGPLQPPTASINPSRTFVAVPRYSTTGRRRPAPTRIEFIN